ncbi:unnamed protein product [Fusarium equiseti]|uniref:C2H2-type domain-containing protein n=1 Tax=Fusarium equiseti TaxID=61235 RepID=A0A8J2IXF4_FUSEQ|nr:unnamed protein product [Fusarium equiseti]
MESPQKRKFEEEPNPECTSAHETRPLRIKENELPSPATIATYASAKLARVSVTNMPSRNINTKSTMYPCLFGEGCARCGPMIPVCMDFPMAHEDEIVVQGFFDFSCQHDDCDESYEDSEKRRQHEITVHNRCLTCTEYFSSEEELKEHQSKSKMVEEERRTHLLQLEMVVRQKEVLAAMLTSSGVPKEEKTEDVTEDKRDKHNIVKPANNAKNEKEAVPAESTSPEILKEEQTEDIHKDQVAETQQDSGGPSKDNPLNCRACNKTFGSTRGFDGHQRTKHDKKTSQKNERLARQDFAMSCDVCGQKRFVTQDALDQHQRQKHQMYVPTNKPEEENESDIWEDFGDFPCIGEKFDCYRQFDTASEMMRHVESGKCVAYNGDEIAEAFMDDLMDYDYRKFYNRKKKCFICPECMGSRFKDLTALLLHAEGDSCSLDTSEGDLHDALEEIPTVCMGGEYFDSDSDGFYRNGDPWENGSRGHPHFQYEFDIEEMESYGYYG